MHLLIPQFLSDLGHDRFMMILGIIIPSWAILMIVLERLFPYTAHVKLFRRGYWIDLIWYTFIQSKVLDIFIFTYIILAVKNALGLAHSGPLSHWNFWLLLFIFFVTHDFYIYWFHRLQHNNKWLWRTHEAHHSVREVDYIAGSRSHPLEILINQTIEFAPMFFLLDTETAMFMYPLKGLIDALWGMWIHANVNVHSGKLQYILNGPEMHQWHHANHYEVFYKNYSTKLAIWDWIFGTAFLPNLKPLHFHFNKPKMYGLPYAYPKGYFSQLLMAIVRFDFRFVEEKSFYNKILNFRKNLAAFILRWFGVKESWTKIELFDDQNHRYDIDKKFHNCPTCGAIQKYFVREKSLVYFCENCSKDVELQKFNS
jgi:sterol desaturase/sphingolipid hydroxylase (fatty acid hydroxylase superfamily)